MMNDPTTKYCSGGSLEWIVTYYVLIQKIHFQKIPKRVQGFKTSSELCYSPLLQIVVVQLDKGLKESQTAFLQ